MKKGFTLIELLVVIAIIGILAATVILNLRGYTNRARDSKVKDYLGQVRTALETYRTDNNDALPGGAAAAMVTTLQTSGLLPANSQTTAMGTNTFSWATGATGGYIVCGQLFSSTNYYYVDSNGASGTSAGCPASP